MRGGRGRWSSVIVLSTGRLVNPPPIVVAGVRTVTTSEQARGPKGCRACSLLTGAGESCDDSPAPFRVRAATSPLIFDHVSAMLARVQIPRPIQFASQGFRPPSGQGSTVPNCVPRAKLLRGRRAADGILKLSSRRARATVEERFHSSLTSSVACPPRSSGIFSSP